VLYRLLPFWLLDNFHIVRQAVGEIRKDMPGTYYSQLPKLTSGPHRRKPRICDIAVEIHVFCKSLLQIEDIKRFIQAYQEISVLDIGELWALPVMCRVVVLDSLRRAVARVAGFPEESGITETPIRGPAELVPDEAVIANAILSLRTLAALDWKEITEALSRILGHSL
jgi:cyclic beta-1,2-glucan synthetase